MTKKATNRKRLQLFTNPDSESLSKSTGHSGFKSLLSERKPISKKEELNYLKPESRIEDIIDEYYRFKIVKGSDCEYIAKTVFTKCNDRIFPDTIFLRAENEFKPYGAKFELSFNDNSFSLYLPKGYQKFLHVHNEQKALLVSLSRNRILLDIIVLQKLNHYSNLLYQMYVDGDFRTVIRSLNKSHRIH